jgi:hypothetical protein
VHVPIACNLGALSPEQRRREQELLAEFRSSRPENRPIDNGYRFEVPNTANFGRLGELLGLERLCCPFLNFRLVVGSAGGPVTLEVWGDDSAAQAFIRDAFAT